MHLVLHPELRAPGTPPRAPCPWYTIQSPVPLVRHPELRAPGTPSRAPCPWYTIQSSGPLVLHPELRAPGTPKAYSLQAKYSSMHLVFHPELRAPGMPKAYSTWYSQAVSHPSTNQARPCLASEIGRDRACSGWYGRRRQQFHQVGLLLSVSGPPYHPTHIAMLTDSQECSPLSG